MKFLTTLAAAAIFSFSLTQPSSAEGEDAPFMTMGAGAVKCSKVLPNLKVKEDLKYIVHSWAQGFVSALNETSDQPRDLRPLNPDYTALAIMDYCMDHPGDLAGQAIADIYERLELIE